VILFGGAEVLAQAIYEQIDAAGRPAGGTVFLSWAIPRVRLWSGALPGIGLATKSCAI